MDWLCLIVSVFYRKVLIAQATGAQQHLHIRELDDKGPNFAEDKSGKFEFENNMYGIDLNMN